jgi:hypothetical protein
MRSEFFTRNSTGLCEVMACLLFPKRNDGSFLKLSQTGVILLHVSIKQYTHSILDKRKESHFSLSNFPQTWPSCSTCKRSLQPNVNLWKILMMTSITSERPSQLQRHNKCQHCLQWSFMVCLSLFFTRLTTTKYIFGTEPQVHVSPQEPAIQPTMQGPFNNPEGRVSHP